MGYYYYLAPQLPYLVYGQGVPMSSAAFIALAQGTMSSADAAMLELCTLDPEPLAIKVPAGEPSSLPLQGPSYAQPVQPSRSVFINKWREWERVLRLNLARGRALKLKRDLELDVPDFPTEAVVAAKNALTMESPLEAEFYLDKARWDAIESFQGTDIFSESSMYAYLLKLLLLERRAAFKVEEGYAEYNALYAAILGEQK